MTTKIKELKHVKNFSKIWYECTESERFILANKFNILTNNAKINIQFNKDNKDHVFKSQLIESAIDLKNFLKPVLVMIDKAV